MPAAEHTTEMPLTLRLSDRARAKLAEQANSSGQDLSTVASDLIEHAVSLPSIAEIMAPVRKQVVESGMSDEELDKFLHDEIEAHRQEKKAKSR